MSGQGRQLAASQGNVRTVVGQAHVGGVLGSTMRLFWMMPASRSFATGVELAPGKHFVTEDHVPVLVFASFPSRRGRGS